MALIGSISDDFNDGVIGAQWTVNGVSPTESGGTLNIPVQSSYQGIQTATTYDLANSQYLAQITSIHAAAAGGSRENMLYMRTGGSEANRAGFLIPGSTGTAICMLTVASVGNDQGFTFSMATTNWLRMRHNGTTLFWETAPDGLTWTVRRSLATPFTLTGLDLLFNTGTWGSEPITPGISWDNFNLAPSAVTTTKRRALLGVGS
jgi:hypothetical protein